MCPTGVRDRAHMVLLNAEGWSAPTIAEILKCHEHTVRAAIKQRRRVAYGKKRGGAKSQPGNQPISTI
ncbi:MAG: helix-turn-helix domain-containing protein [Phormidesmis sp.]